MNSIRFAGIACTVGGVAFFGDLGLHLFGGLVGISLWLAAFTLLFFNPGAAFSQRLTPGGLLLMALGLIVLGIATASSGLLRGWRRWAPLLVGVYFPLQLVVQLAFFLNGRDGASGSNGILLGLWALLGYAIASSSGQPRAAGPVPARS